MKRALITGITGLIYNFKPDEIYHLGAQSHVRVSFDFAEYSSNITGLGTSRISEPLRRLRAIMSCFKQRLVVMT